MVKRIIAFLMLPSLIIAMFLSLGGVHSIPFDSPYMYSFFNSVASRFNSFHLQIPNIPKIPQLEFVSISSFWTLVLNLLIAFVKLHVTFINAISTVINVLITIINFLFSIIEYALIFIYSLKDLRNGLISASVFV